jgi:predicted Zn-dependent peptidase
LRRARKYATIASAPRTLVHRTTTASKGGGVPRVFTHTYPNGLVLVAEERPDVRAAAFHLSVLAGTITEPADKEGLSKVLAEMCYRGAGERDSRALSDALDALGLQRGGGAGTESATFGGALLADNLGDALKLHADIALRPRLPEKELEPVVALAIQELQSLEDNPAQKMFVHLRREYFLNDYGRSTLGTVPTLEGLTVDDLRADHRNRYRPKDAILSVAGRFDWNWLRDTVGALFGDWNGDPPPLPKPDARATTHYRHIEQDSAQEHIGIAYASVPLGDPDFYVSRMAVNVLSGGMGARLFTEVREKRGLVYAVSASASSARGLGFVFGYAGTTPERAQETLDVYIGELNRLVEGVTKDELDRARVGLLSSLVMQGESTTARASAIGTDMVLLGRVRSLEEIREGIENVTQESIIAHLRRCPPANFTVTTLGPRPLTMPD